MAARKALPRHVFVHWQYPYDNGPPWLVAEEQEGASLEVGEVQIAGRYELIEQLTITNNVKVLHKPTRIGHRKASKKARK